jgi:DNA-binding transcriptional MerR regulator
LLKPAKIDPQNNYRYYTVEQLPRIHRIMALKELGLSLEQIGLMLDEDLPTDQIRGMLRYRRAEIHQQAREAQKQLATIEFHLRMIEAEINFPVLDVIIKRLAAMRFLSFFVGPHPTLDDGEKVFSTVVNGLNQSIEAGLIQHTGVTIDVFHGETILPFESPDLHDR